MATAVVLPVPKVTVSGLRGAAAGVRRGAWQLGVAVTVNECSSQPFVKG